MDKDTITTALIMFASATAFFGIVLGILYVANVAGAPDSEVCLTWSEGKSVCGTIEVRFFPPGDNAFVSHDGKTIDFDEVGLLGCNKERISFGDLKLKANRDLIGGNIPSITIGGVPFAVDCKKEWL
jgi:hypothetical protein